MAIPIRVLTAVLKKGALAASYPGGLTRFFDEHPGIPEDDQLVGVPFMPGGYQRDFVDRLQASGRACWAAPSD